MIELREFGIEKKDDSNNTSVCPATVANATSIDLYLEAPCSLPRSVESKDFNQFQKKVAKWFDDDCRNKQNCTMRIYENDTYPEQCTKLFNPTSSPRTPREEPTGCSSSKADGQEYMAYAVVLCASKYISTTQLNETNNQEIIQEINQSSLTRE